MGIHTSRRPNNQWTLRAFFTDEHIKDALQQAGLGSKAVYAEVGTSGSGWSLGDKQLVSAMPRGRRAVSNSHSHASPRRLGVSRPRSCKEARGAPCPASLSTLNNHKRGALFARLTRAAAICLTRPRAELDEKQKRYSSAFSRRSLPTPLYFELPTGWRRCAGAERAWK